MHTYSLFSRKKMTAVGRLPMQEFWHKNFNAIDCLVIFLSSGATGLRGISTASRSLTFLPAALPTYLACGLTQRTTDSM